MLEKLIGVTDVATFAANIFFGLLGVFLSLLWHTTARNPNSPNTPVKFSWAFLFSDNLKRIVSVLLTLYLAIRFYPDMFGKPANEYLALGLGLTTDKLAEFIKNKTNLLDMDRDKLQ